MGDIRKQGSPVLLQVAEKVASTDNYRPVVNRLKETFKTLRGAQGLAAPQIGISKRIILCKLKGEINVMINPVILRKFGSRKSNEGCESVNKRYIVKRPILGKITYTTEEGENISRWFTWKQMRIICHEVDHLDGKCINNVGEEWKPCRLTR